jgi:HD superfamily phosphohydrolase
MSEEEFNESWQQKSNDKKPHTKTLKDPIYGHIDIPPLCLAFMDVPEFQRLRRVRQLGLAYYVYPSVSHSRFEHSLGVMHLAGKMVDKLRDRVEITDRTKDLIQLAGLYHDIGHFAYSHLFDHFLESAKINDTIPEIFKYRNHEHRSIHFLHKVNARLKLLSQDEEDFVGYAILGHVPKDHISYLYQIVCNESSKIDVDRLDYLNRDAFWAGASSFHSDYILLCATVDKDSHLAFKDKARREIKYLFETRQRMYENIYNHPTTMKLDKIYFCMMSRLGPKLFSYGEKTDDYNIETLFRNSPETQDLMTSIDNRDLYHDCEICRDYSSTKFMKSGGSIDNVRFVGKSAKI